jgi:hypothetical protein
MTNLIFRKQLITQKNAAITIGGSADFGAFNVGRYCRFTGLVSTVGSLTLRISTGVASGSFQFSSNFAANSGASVIDCLNFGQYGYFDITVAKSTVYSLVIHGEPLR